MQTAILVIGCRMMLSPSTHTALAFTVGFFVAIFAGVYHPNLSCHWLSVRVGQHPPPLAALCGCLPSTSSTGTVAQSSRGKDPVSQQIHGGTKQPLRTLTADGLSGQCSTSLALRCRALPSRASCTTSSTSCSSAAGTSGDPCTSSHAGSGPPPTPPPRLPTPPPPTPSAPPPLAPRCSCSLLLSLRAVHDIRV